MQQKPVRFYITQDADEPVVRTVPATSARPEEPAATEPVRPQEPPAAATASTGPVRKIVPATRRAGGTPGR